MQQAMLDAEAKLIDSAEPAKTADVLRAARALIADPARWTRGQLACDAVGRSVKPNNPKAVRWCVMGAIRKADPDDRLERGTAHTALRLGLRRLGFSKGPMSTNDRHGHAAILAALDAAIVEVMEGKLLDLKKPAPANKQDRPKPRPPAGRKAGVGHRKECTRQLELPLW